MDKVINYCKNHFVETIGLLVIVFLIFFISYLKYFRKSFECESIKTEGSTKVVQKYSIKQRNNHIKSIAYYYEVTSPNKKEMEQIINFYKNLIEQNKDELEDNHISFKYKKNKLVLYYDISQKEIKDNKLYKSTRNLVRSLKASDFTCK